MTKRGSKTMTGRMDERGFTLIELLVVIIILGVLSAVVVFAVRGVGDKGQASAFAIDGRTIRTAQEAFCAQNSRYGTELELVNGKFLSEPGSLHRPTQPVASDFPGATGNCPTGGAAASKFTLDCPATMTGCGAGGSLPRGGTLKVPGTSTPGNVLGINFVNPAVTSSGTSHPNVEYMFNGLLRWSESNAAAPDLANFTVAPDQMSATFTLLPGLKWHNNTDILNTDVKFTFEQALFKFHSRTGPSMVPALGGTGGGTSGASVPAGAIDVGTAGVVKFNFVTAYAPIMLKQMNVTEAPILPQNVYGPCASAGNIQNASCPANNPANNADFPADTATNQSPVGSGPFRFRSRNASTGALAFVNRNTAGGVGPTPYHRAGLPLADELLQVPTANVADSLVAKSIDVGTPNNNRIAPIVPPQMTADITTAAGYTLAPVPRGTGGGNCITTFPFHLWQSGTTTNSIGSLPADAPYTHELFGDPTPVDPDGAGPLGLMPRGKVVRRAISMGIDRTSIFNVRDSGKGKVANSPYHSLLPPYAPQPAFPAFATATAATFLENAGWTVSGTPAIRRSTGAAGMPAAGTPLAWQVRRVSGGQNDLYLDMKTNLAVAPVSIDVAAGTGSHAELPVDTSTNVTGALVNGARNFDMLVVSFCAGDEPVIGVRRQFHSDGLPATGAPSNFTNPAGVRSTVMDGLWNTAFGANYTPKHQGIQALAADDAYQLLFSESSTERAWRTGCQGFNNFNTGLYIEGATCASR